MLRLLAWLVRVVGLAVPRAHRSRWREEWLGELAQVAGTRSRMTVLQFMRGAALDALAMRRVISMRTQHSLGGDRFMTRRFSAMDFKLGVRMLVRYPGLSCIGVLGMAIGIMISAGAFSILYTLTDAALPLDEGDRIVTIHTIDTARGNPERRVLHDFVQWREQLTSVEDLGAFRQVTRNLIVPGRQAEAVTVTEISASAFRVTRVPPLMGRALAPDDERPGAAPVLVLGHDVWRTHFGSDASVVGRSVQLGDTLRAIVGVMPEGYKFPVSNSFWVPLPITAALAPRSGPSVTTFARLAAGATLDTAQAELTAAGRRASLASPKTHETLQPRVLPYTYPFFDINDPSMVWMIHVVQFWITLLLVIICVNVAILVFARTARRQGEIAVRSALGASRSRIVSQLFTEGLALAAVAAVVGLWFTAVGLQYVNTLTRQMFPSQFPFWWEFRLSAGVIWYVVGLTFLSAGIVGALPALKATSGRLQLGLQGITAGGGASMRLGRTWAVLIVAQVAIAVALLPAAVFQAWDAVRHGTANPGFPAHEYLSTQLALDGGTAPAQATAGLYATRVRAVIDRLRAEPEVAAVSYGTSAAGEEATMVVEVDGIPVPQRGVDYNIPEGSRNGLLVRFSRVDVDFFRTFEVPLLTGRTLTATDAIPSATAIVVNRTFADAYLGGHVLGRRVRYVGRSGDASPGHIELGRWYEVVGVVGDFPNRVAQGVSPSKIYHALDITQTLPITLAIRVRGADAMQFAPRLRDIAASADPNLQVRDLATLDATLREEQSILRLTAAVLAALTLSVVLLSAAGVYSMMSFTVAQRRKEIGIRTALGADPRRILSTIFSRVLWQLATGAAIGATVAGLLELATEGGLMQGHAAVVLPIVAVLVIIVGILAAIGPARTGLRVHPTEALRQE